MGRFDLSSVGEKFADFEPIVVSGLVICFEDYQVGHSHTIFLPKQSQNLDPSLKMDLDFGIVKMDVDFGIVLEWKTLSHSRISCD